VLNRLVPVNIYVSTIILKSKYLLNFHLDKRTAVSADIRTENDQPVDIQTV